MRWHAWLTAFDADPGRCDVGEAAGFAGDAAYAARIESPEAFTACMALRTWLKAEDDRWREERIARAERAFMATLREADREREESAAAKGGAAGGRGKMWRGRAAVAAMSDAGGDGGCEDWEEGE